MPRASKEDKPENHACENCSEHRATSWWVGSGGSLAVSRFYMQAAWCGCCMLKAQVEHAEEQAAKLGQWYQELEKLVCSPA